MREHFVHDLEHAFWLVECGRQMEILMLAICHNTSIKTWHSKEGVMMDISQGQEYKMVLHNSQRKVYLFTIYPIFIFNLSAIENHTIIHNT